jgi:hypothetical protein
MKNIYNHLFWTGSIVLTFAASFLILVGINVYPYISIKSTKKNEVFTNSPVSNSGENIFVLQQNSKDLPKETIILKETPKPIQQITKPLTVHDTVHDAVHEPVHDTTKNKVVTKDTTSSKTL